MSKLIYSMRVSLDGYIAGAGDEISMPVPDEEEHRVHNQHARELGAHLCGRRLYEVMTYWDDFAEREPSADDYELEFAGIWRDLPKVVFSNSLDSVGHNATLAAADLADVVTELKRETQGDLAVGGAHLAAQCLALDLIDEFRLFVVPVALGGGTPYFLPGAGIELRLAETRAFAAGTVYLRYERVR